MMETSWKWCAGWQLETKRGLGKREKVTSKGIEGMGGRRESRGQRIVRAGGPQAEGWALGVEKAVRCRGMS